MKKTVASIVFSFFVMLFGIGLSLAEAALTEGTYNLSSGINNGFWIEGYGTPGSPGAGGNELFAFDGTMTINSDGLPDVSTTYGEQWAMQMVSEPAIASTKSGYTYQTSYSGYFYVLEGPWGDGLVTTDYMTGFNYSNSTNTSLDFLFEATGSGVDIIDNKPYRVVFSATFDSSDLNSLYWQGKDENGLFWGHAGNHFTNVSMTITQVPIPAAAWLLGSGVLGLVLVKRKTIM